MKYLYFINIVYRNTLCFYPHKGLLKQIADQAAMTKTKKKESKLEWGRVPTSTDTWLWFME